MRRLVGPNSSRTPRGLLVQWYYIAKPILTIASRNNLVLLGTFITLLQAVAFTSADREALQKLWERLRWQLRIFSRGNELFEGALKRLDEKRTWVENILEKGFTPVKPVSRIHQQQPHPLVSPDSKPISGFPGFPTQSMEDLLNTEGLVVHNVHNAHNYADGLLRFEEFSGWDGFDIHNL